MPLLSGISIHAGSSGLTPYDLFAKDGVDFTQKVREKAVFGLDIKDELSGRFNLDILNIGFRSAKNPANYYSMGMYLEGDAIGYWFKDLAILGFEGNADYIGKRFNLGHLKTRAELVNVFHFGINKKWNNKLIVGARAKLYSGIFNFTSTNNSGYFVTTEGERNILASTLNSNMRLRTSGIDGILDALDDDSDSQPLSSVLTKRAFFGGNLGLGLDLGFTYNLNKETVLTASVLDLGFIRNSVDVKSFSLKGQATVEGVEIILPDALADPDQNFWQDLVDRIEEEIPFQEDNSAYITFRPTVLNASIRRNWGETGQKTENCECGPYSNDISNTTYANAIGAHLYVINRPRGPQTALTLFYQKNLGSNFSLKTTYTADKFSYTNVGLGLSLSLGPAQFYILADNLLAYKNLADTHYASFQLGINIISSNR